MASVSDLCGCVGMNVLFLFFWVLAFVSFGRQISMGGPSFISPLRTPIEARTLIQ